MRPALPCLFMLTACGATPQVNMDAERAALTEAAERYHRAATTKDRDAVVAFYADDAIMIPPDADRVEGIEGVRNYRFGFIESPGVELRFDLIEVEVSSSGDMGWTLAIGNVSFTDETGQPGRDRVRDFHTWRKVNGRWKLVVDVWNSNPPVTNP